MKPLVASFLSLIIPLTSLAGLEPVIPVLRAEPVSGTRSVEISFEVRDPDSETVTVYLKVSSDGGRTWNVPAGSATGAVGRRIKTGTLQRIRWDASVDHPRHYEKDLRFGIGVTDWVPSEGMNLIPEGTFEMAGPAHLVSVSEFAIDVHEVTKELWDTVRRWSLDHGYLDLPTGESFGSGHPVHTVNWFDCVKWCNARSEMEGLRPAYHVDAAATLVYRSGRLAPHVDWKAGYRLPTEAEWEKAARGGSKGHRFPWSDSEKITPDRANYDESEKSGSVKVGSYPPNDYGLYDMAGNHFEWCWDRFGEYTSDAQTDPRGPDIGVHRVFRGGSWYDNAKNCEIAHRRAFTPDTVYNRVGFRSALPQPARPWIESETQAVTLDSHPRVTVNGLESDGPVTVGDRAVVRLAQRFEHGQIFYTLDGTRPTVHSTKYTGEFRVDQSAVLRDLHLNEELTETLEPAPVRITVVPTVPLEAVVEGQGRLEFSPHRDRYLRDETVAIRALPADGWRLARWGGDLSGSEQQQSLIMAAQRSIRAVFEPIPRYPITIDARGGKASGAGTYLQSERINLKAMADSGWDFLGWSGAHVGTESNLTWEVKSSAHFVASFGTAVATVATGGGKVLLEPSLPVYPHGTVVRVIAVPDPGYGLSLWGGAAAGQTQGEWTFTVTNASPKISALFGPVLKPCP